MLSRMSHQRQAISAAKKSKSMHRARIQYMALNLRKSHGNGQYYACR